VSEEEIKPAEDIIQLAQQELSEEDVINLVKKTLKQGEHEAMFILTLNEWSRPGPSFKDYGKFEVLYGDVQMFQLDNIYDYPTTDETVYAIIPKTKLVVILYQWANDYQGKLQEYAKLYVFNYSRGWVSIDLY